MARILLILHFLLLLLNPAESSEGTEVDEAVPSFPNIGYLGRGYDIFWGNPSTTSGTDPGFRMQIFNFIYGSRLTPDNRYRIPDGTEVYNAETCSTSFDSREVTTANRYSEMVSRHVDASVGYANVKFTASHDYKDVKKNTQSYRKTYTFTEAECTKYQAALLPFTPPSLSENFKDGVKFLPMAVDKAKLGKFVKYFGTHVASSLMMGARYGEMSELETTSWEHYKETTSSWKISVSGSATFSFGGSVSSETVKTNIENFKKIAKSQKIISLGSRPPATGGALIWAQSVFKNPMPVKYSLLRVDKLLSSDYFTGKEINASQLAQKRQILTKYLDGLCSELVAQKVIETCHPVDPPRPPPKTTKTCRMCKSCSKSGPYSLESGQLIKDGDWGPWEMFGSECKGPMTHAWAEWRLCCSPPVPECRMCATCGYEYPLETGRRDNGGDYGPYYIYQDECSGPYSRSWAKFRLCCRSKASMCVMCDECGNGMEKVGVRLREGDYGPFRVFASNYCNSARIDYAKSMGLYGSGLWGKYDVTWCCTKQ